ncbi:MAG TPA: PilX N-terminal domain-containing pilus assembly protein [Candidatus Nanoarchaeia archaeon]
MSLPRKFQNKIKSSRGQILIVFLLILVLGTAVVLSVASRTVSDVRITTTSDESNRAYFAAEAGIEEALKQLQSDISPTTPVSLDFEEINTDATVTIADTATATRFVYPDEMEKDDVAQVVLLTDFSNIDSAAWGGSNLTFYWNHTGTPAIEISVIYATKVGASWVIQQGDISKIAFDTNGARAAINGFCSNITTGAWTFGGKQFTRSASVNVYQGAGNENCNGLDLANAATTKPLFARVKMLYNSSPLAVQSNVGNLPAQGHEVESSGQTVSGVTRKLQAIRLYPALPGLYDYVLFNAGSKLEK